MEEVAVALAAIIIVKMGKIGFILIGIISLVVLFFLFGGFGYMEEQNSLDVEPGDVVVREFELNATRFEYSPDTVLVNKGDLVRIKINNIDTMHGIRIPSYGVRDENFVEFIANKSGEFDFFCTVFCGDEHREMKGRLVVQ